MSTRQSRPSVVSELGSVRSMLVCCENEALKHNWSFTAYLIRVAVASLDETASSQSEERAGDPMSADLQSQPLSDTR
jgi:hypothetical protein